MKVRARRPPTSWRDPNQPVTTSELVVLLFGSPLDPSDEGIIGRITRRLDRLLRLGWSILVALITVLAGIAADLISRSGAIHP